MKISGKGFILNREKKEQNLTSLMKWTVYIMICRLKWTIYQMICRLIFLLHMTSNFFLLSRIYGEISVETRSGYLYFFSSKDRGCKDITPKWISDSRIDQWTSKYKKKSCHENCYTFNISIEHDRLCNRAQFFLLFFIIDKVWTKVDENILFW